MNKKFTKFCFVFGICFLICVIDLSAQTSYTIVPGVRIGEITARTSKADLIRIFGSKNVRDAKIGLGEGETVPGTVIFPNNPSKSLEIVWKDKKSKKSPDFIQLSGDKSLWKTKEGIRLGTSLKELEKLNGKSFVLAGFEWDYSGAHFSWEGGKLAKAFGNKGEKLALRLSPKDYEKVPRKDADAVLGDGEFSSANEAMQRINPRVYFIYVDFP